MSKDILVSNQSPPTVRNVEWTPERIRTFWTNLRTTPLERSSFARTAGTRFYDILESLIPVENTVLDVACGSCVLIQRLIERGYRAGGMDIALPDHSEVLAGLLGNDSFLGVYNSLPDRTFDTLIASEVLEHIPLENVSEAIGMWLDVLKPGGTMIVTVPNKERLDNSFCLCPDCGAYFHRWQHLHSVGRKDLQCWFEEQHNMELVHYGEYDFSSDEGGRTMIERYRRSRRAITENLLSTLAKAVDANTNTPMPREEFVRLLADTADRVFMSGLFGGKISDPGIDHAEGGRQVIIYAVKKI